MFSGMDQRILKLERILKRLHKLWEAKRSPRKKVYFRHRVSEYRDIWRSVAELTGGRLHELSEGFWEFELSGRKTRLSTHLLEFDNPITLELASKKPLMHRLLKERGLKVPEHEVYRLQELSRAYAFLDKYPRGCVVKPANGTHAGDGVTTNVLTPGEVRKASVLASLYCPDILIEKQIPGECYRLLVICGEMVHAVRRTGPRLTGDGKSNVRDLVKQENRARSDSGKPLLELDRDCVFTLGWQGLSPDTVPACGHVFLFKSSEQHSSETEVRTVYNEDVTGLICPSVRKTAEEAANVLGSDFVGVDIITKDPSVSLEQSDGAINEVNTTPALHHHYDHEKEKFPAPAVIAIRKLLNRR